MRFTRLLLVLCLLFLSSESIFGEEITQGELRKFTEGAIRNRTVKVIPPDMDWSGDLVLLKTLGYANISKGTLDIPLETALEAQFTVSIIRQYRNTGTQRQFWEPVLTRVESRIQRILDLRSSGESQEEIDNQTLEISSEISADYFESLTRLARQYGKKGLAAAAPWEQYQVSVQTVPSGGKVQYMDSGIWELYNFAKAQGKEVIEPQWSTILTEKTDLGGMYWFKVTWPDGTVRRWREEVTKTSQTLIFRK